jgi:hypothetical protein
MILGSLISGLILRNLADRVHLSQFWIDHMHNNWFTSWLQVVAADHLVPPPNGSIHDLDIGTTFGWSSVMYAAWTGWLSTHPGNNTFAPTVSSSVIIVPASGPSVA